MLPFSPNTFVSDPCAGSLFWEIEAVLVEENDILGFVGSIVGSADVGAAVGTGVVIAEDGADE